MRKAISDVVVTILLVLISIASVIIVAGFIIPMINESLQGGKGCLESRDQVSLGSYTCYDSENSRTQIMIEIGNKIDVKGIAVSLLVDGEWDRYDIINNTVVQGINMYDGSNTLILPEKGGAETYVFSFVSKSVEIAPILEDGNMCKGVSAEILEC